MQSEPPGSTRKSSPRAGRPGIRRAHHRLTAALLAALLLAGAPPLAADDSARNVMANAMARMMDAMGLFGDGGSGGSMADTMRRMSGMGSGQLGMTPFGTNAFGMNPFLPGQYLDWSRFAQQPWSSGMQDAARAFGMEQMLPAIPGLPGWTGTTLEGIWEGRDGGLLIVQRQRFRLYGPQCGHIEGLIQQRGDRVAMYEPERDIARPFEFAQHQGRLVLRDPGGQVYLYRRLWLDDSTLMGRSGDPGDYWDWSWGEPGARD
jgi:hypothetical protein